MMHYQSTEESDIAVTAEGMLLIDSGGQYYGGTTDVTRTFILGPISDEERKYFTLVLKSMLTLADAKFLSGCRGSNLDILAREPLWEEGVDYRCGTGHGVGYFLGVHEGPNAFRWRSNPENLDAVLQPGMVITDEPVSMSLANMVFVQKTCSFAGNGSKTNMELSFILNL